MTMPDSSNEEAPATLSTFARSLLIISLFLASLLLGSGFENLMDEGNSWVQIYRVVAPALLMLCLGYVLVKCRES